MRIPYVPNPPPTSTPEEADVVAKVLARRGDLGLIALDRALLHSFPVADGWNSLLGAIRTKTSLPADIREIAICRVAIINEAWYEWKAHAPILKAAGFSDEQLRILEDTKLTGTEEAVTSAYSRKQAAVLRYADSMTKTVKVADDVFAELKALFSETEIVEITATVAAYNCVSRFLVALDVGEQNQ
jgi:alkylhydroperoxidase family enzyme